MQWRRERDYGSDGRSIWRGGGKYRKCKQRWEKITNMVKENMGIVTNAVSQIGRISDVVEQNVEISHNTKKVSSNMAEITGKLLEIVE